MKGYEITKQLKERRRDSDAFIKWWRKENDFLDYDLIDRYVSNFRDSEEIAGFDLLTIDDMWREVKHICGDRVTRTGGNGSQQLSWQPPGDKPIQVCAYTPQSLIAIYDRETKGNPIDH